MHIETRANRNRHPQIEGGVGWYCLRTRRNQEQLAAAHVRLLEDVAVFCPRIKLPRPTKAGTGWVTEALFPGYFFARFSLQEMLPSVRSAHGVISVVRFGNWYPDVADNVIEELRVETEDRVAEESVSPWVPGDRVRLVGGALAGLEAVVTQVLPGNERVRLLLDFLGQETVAEARAEHLVPGENWFSRLTVCRSFGCSGGWKLPGPARYK